MHVHVAVLFDRLGPYHRARLRAAAEKMTVSAIEIAGASAEYAWEEVETDDRLHRRTLFPNEDRQTIGRRRLARAVHATLNQRMPDVVAVPGWSHPGALVALRWSEETNTPAVMMSETTAHDFERTWWREWPKRRLLSCCEAGLVGGTDHQAYLTQLGMVEDDIFFGYDVVDNAHFATGAEAARSNADVLRDEHALPERFFLASCRFIAKKNLPRLLEAFALYRAQGPEESWDLVLLGDGPERGTVKDVIARHDLDDAVHLPGFKQYDQLPLYYGLAGAFIHASTREQWGLVVNEAMAAGLPVVVSERCGCATDLVEEGENGYTIEPYDPSDLADRMLQLAHGSQDLARMGRKSRERIDQWRPERFADGLQSAAQTALDKQGETASLLDRLIITALAYR